MKRIVAILAVVVSAGAFAQTQDNTPNQKTDYRGHHLNHGRVMQQVESLTPEQQDEFNELHAKQMKERQKLMLDIKEVDLKIQREMTAENPNQKNIDKLIDQRAGLRAQHQKNMLKFRLDMKEKFGIQMDRMMNGDRKCGMRDSRGMNGNKRMMKRSMHA